MKNRSTRQALSEDIKREVLMDLSRARVGSGRERDLVDSIKQEIMMELGQPHHDSPYPDREFMEAVKGEVLNQLRYEMGSDVGMANRQGSTGYPSRAAIESIKREIIAQIEADTEAREESNSRGYQRGASDPALIQAIKNSVLAEMSIHPIQ
ncbi:MAG: hypothetical protein GX349_04775 [Firmicutes bacterium]|nr:hypothetical protein [Bacillota bacterium]